MKYPEYQLSVRHFIINRKMRNLLLLLVFLYAPCWGAGYFKKQTEFNTVTADDIRAFAFKECYDINSSKADIYNDSRPSDLSFFWVKVALSLNERYYPSKEYERLKKLEKFIADNTGDFYLTTNEENGDISYKIVEQCMDFYNSDALKNYINTNFSKVIKAAK